MITSGVIMVDLTAVKEDRQRNRIAAALGTAPKGATVEVIVGPLRVNPDAHRVLREYAERRHLNVIVKGEGNAVGAWVSALRTGELMGVLL